jgi:hypothetical protein
MPSPHDPDHTRGASVLLPEEMEETERHVSGGKALKANDSPSSARFWLGLIAFLFGLAVLATGLIFFSAWPGTLAVEVVGAGLALLGICALVISGAWLPTRPRPKEASISDASPDLSTSPASPATPPTPEIHSSPPASTEPISLPAVPSLEETIQAEVNAATGASSETPAAAASEAAPAPGKRTTRPQKPEAQNGQRQSARPSPRPSSALGSVTEPRLPALTNLPAGLPPFVDRNLIDADANDMGDLLGDIAEQTVLAMLTRGQRGTQRRERMAAKIEVFRKEMAVDPDYAAVTNFLESITGLLRAGTIMPASRPLVEPFDGLYDYVLTLIRRKSGAQHD